MTNTHEVSSARILLVEDEEDMCELIKLRLEHHGFLVTTGHCVDEALDALAAHEFDVMLIDFRLHERSGLDIISSVRLTGPPLPSVVFTADPAHDVARQALQGGAAAFLTKPYDAGELIEKIYDVLKTHVRRSSPATQRKAPYE